jgi:hypothetical protein
MQMKSTFKYQILEELNRGADPVNEDVVSNLNTATLNHNLLYFNIKRSFQWDEIEW